MQEHGWVNQRQKGRNGQDKKTPEGAAAAKVWSMRQSAQRGQLKWQGYPTGHVIDVLWGSGGKFIQAMGQDQLCASPLRSARRVRALCAASCARCVVCESHQG